MTYKQFLQLLFVGGSGISSKRFLSYIVALVMLVYIWFSPSIEIVWCLASLVAGLQGLTLFNAEKNTITDTNKIGFQQEEKNL